MRNLFLLSFLLIAPGLLVAQESLTLLKSDTCGSLIRDYNVLASDTTVRHGTYIERLNRVIVTKGQYENNLYDGLWSLYFETGKPEALVMYSKGELNGTYVFFGTNGDTSYTCMYASGQKNGRERTFYSPGVIMESTDFVNGKAQGISTAYYKTGMLKHKMPYVAGNREGSFALYYESGQLQEQCTYKNDKLDGRVIYYHPNGKVYMELEYKDGNLLNLLSQKRENEKAYTNTGSLKNGTGSLRVYYANDSLKLSETYLNGQLDGPAYYFDNKGQFIARGEYAAGKRNKLWLFYSNGNVDVEKNYSNGVPEGPYKIYYENGAVKETGEMTKGNYVKGSVRYYNQNGLETPFGNSDNPSPPTSLALAPGTPATGAYDEYTEQTFQIVETPARFLGGDMELIHFLRTNVKYPVYCKDNGISGLVLIGFTVEKMGQISDVKIIKSVHPLLDEEAMRVIRAMPRWEPGCMQGRPVRVQCTVPIRFTLH